MTRWQRFIAPVLTAGAIGYLAVMVFSGAQPVLRQNVPFEAKGVLRTQPDQVRRVEVSRGEERITLVRRDDKKWVTPAGTDLDSDAGRRLSMAVQMMHTSGPAREITPDELAGVDVAAFELDPPRITARLYEDGTKPILTVRFGGHNPDGYLQYMRVEGDPNVYLMSRFVGEEWMEALNGSLRR